MQRGYLSLWCLSCCGLLRSGWHLIPKLLLLDFILSKLSISLCCWNLPPLTIFFVCTWVCEIWKLFALVTTAVLIHNKSLMVVPGHFFWEEMKGLRWGLCEWEALLRDFCFQRSVGIPQVFLAFLGTFPEVTTEHNFLGLSLISAPFFQGYKGGKGNFQKEGTQIPVEWIFLLLASMIRRAWGTRNLCWIQILPRILGRIGFFLPCSGGQASSRCGPGGFGDSWPKPRAWGSPSGTSITSSPGRI